MKKSFIIKNTICIIFFISIFTVKNNADLNDESKYTNYFLSFFVCAYCIGSNAICLTKMRKSYSEDNDASNNNEENISFSSLDKNYTNYNVDNKSDTYEQLSILLKELINARLSCLDKDRYAKSNIEIELFWENNETEDANNEFDDDVHYSNSVQDEFESFYQSNLIIVPPQEVKEVTLGNLTIKCKYDSERDLYYISEDFQHTIIKDLEEINMHIYDAASLINIALPLFDIDNINFDYCVGDHSCLQYHPFTKTGKHAKYPVTVHIIQSHNSCVIYYLKDASIGKLRIVLIYKSDSYILYFVKKDNRLSIKKIEKKANRETELLFTLTN